MTEITAKLIDLPPAIQRFVLQWGDMGGQWGVNRTVAQIHALLFIMEKPLNAEQISETLGIARSNVSNSLRELLGWRIIERVPIPGDRRDHFTAERDIWEMALRIAAVRKEREFDPTIRTLEACLAEAKDDLRVSEFQRDQLKAMHEFTSTMDN
ncbi:MAG: MarR family transcriptional regulator, partial [Pseudomonadota bacterium]